MGADAYGGNAIACVDLAKDFVKEKAAPKVS